MLIGCRLRRVAKLGESGEIVCVTPQTLIEFWCVATRPREVNGLGWDLKTATVRMNDLLDIFEMLEDSPDVFDTWHVLVRSHGILGQACSRCTVGRDNAGAWR